MKRAIFVMTAALLVLLSYPSTESQAGPPDRFSASQPNTHPTEGGDTDAAFTGEDGDADDIQGFEGTGTRRGKMDPGSAGTVRSGGIRTMVRIWWNFMIFVR